jgi:hypothetical protein
VRLGKRAGFVMLSGNQQTQKQSELMKRTLISTWLISLGATAALAAASFPDSSGDNSGGFLDITSVDMNNSATTLTLTVNVAGNPSDPGNNWGKFLIGFDTTPGGGGNFNAVNGWGKDIQMSAGGMDYFIGSWLDWGTGADLKSWSGSQWDVVTATYLPNPFNLSLSVGISSVSYTFDLAALGLAAGSIINFDVYASTGGGDTVVDSSGNPAPQTWGSAPYDTGMNYHTYTVTAVPEPAVGALVGLSLLVLGRRLKRG